MLIAFLSMAVGAQASTIVFSTPAGATVGGQPVSATARFETAMNRLFVLVSGLWANPRSTDQAFSGVAFSISGGLAGTSLVSSETSLIDVASNGTFTSFGAGPTGWVLDGSGLLLCVLCPGGAGPSHLILGWPGPGGVYSNANESIAGNGPHNPFGQGYARFVMSMPGLTAGHTVTGSTFFFSTDAVPIRGGEVLEPSSLLLAGSGIIALVLFSRRRCRRGA